MEAAQLTETIVWLAKRRCNTSQKVPRWAKLASSPEGRGAVRSVAGFMANRIRKGNFCFSTSLTQLTQKKLWEAGVPNRLSREQYEDLPDEARSEFRISFALSLPDHLLHTIVAAVVGQKLEPMLSPHCYAYRSGKGLVPAVRQVRKLNASADKWIVRCDVRRFNETVDHRTLRKLVKERLLPEFTDDQARLVDGTLDGLCILSQQATNRPGKGMVVGSALTPPLTNLYLTPLDEACARAKVPFIRYGDDLLAFCDSERQATQLVENLRMEISNLGQQENDSPAFHPTWFWMRGLKLAAATDCDLKALEWAERRSALSMTGVFPPGEPFDFLGFEFLGGRARIRQQTLAKIKRRIEQYTQRSKPSDEQACGVARADPEIVIWRSDDGDVVAQASVRFIARAIRRINRLIGFEDSDGAPGASNRRVRLNPRYSWPWRVLDCADYEDVREQFRILDAYAYRRLQHLLHGVVPVELGQEAGRPRTLRTLGLRTFKDVANMHPVSQRAGAAAKHTKA
ncbi:MAG: reverse transcriptase domain-containing protein [Limisphaerales bacterium]